MANQARRKNQDIAHDMPLPWWKSTSSPFSTRSRINADAPGLARSPLTWCLRLANESSCLTALHHQSDYAAWASCTNRAESSVHSCEHRPSPGNVKGHRSQHKPCACRLSCGKAVPRTCCPDFAALRYIHHETIAVWHSPRGSPGPGPWRTIGPHLGSVERRPPREKIRGLRSGRQRRQGLRRPLQALPEGRPPLRRDPAAPVRPARSSAPIAVAHGLGMGGDTLNFGEQWVLLFRRVGDKVHSGSSQRPLPGQEEPGRRRSPSRPPTPTPC